MLINANRKILYSRKKITSLFQLKNIKCLLNDATKYEYLNSKNVLLKQPRKLGDVIMSGCERYVVFTVYSTLKCRFVKTKNMSNSISISRHIMSGLLSV